MLVNSVGNFEVYMCSWYCEMNNGLVDLGLFCMNFVKGGE